jgi:membrane protease YdiL (CAAX protease family)
VIRREGEDNSPRPTEVLAQSLSSERWLDMTFVRRHRVAAFFVLAYFLAWAGVPWGSFYAPGALLAALIVIVVTEGMPGLRRLGARCIRWRVSWIWYVLAVAVPLSVHLMSISANMAVGASAPSLGFLTWYGLPLAIGLHIVDPFGGPLMEEPSFRGFAQPEMEKGRSRLAATAIMAVLISGWHAPLFFMPVFEAHPIGFVTTVAVTFWYAWLFNHAGGSVLLTLIAHAVEGSVETNNLWAGADLERLNWTYAIVWSLVALTLVVLDRRFWAHRDAPRGTETEALATGPITMAEPGALRRRT